MHDQLIALRTCLNDLQNAMQGGYWESLGQLTRRLTDTLQQLSGEHLQAKPAEADELRRLIALVAELQSQANARKQQIGPLLAAWRRHNEAGDPTPP